MITWSDPVLKVERDLPMMADIYILRRLYGDEQFVADVLVFDDYDLATKAEVKRKILAETKRVLLQQLDETAFPMFTGGVPDHPNLVW